MNVRVKRGSDRNQALKSLTGSSMCLNDYNTC
jgi:hypothetical protein